MRLVRPVPQAAGERFIERIGLDRLVFSYGSTEVGMVASRDHDPGRLASPGRVGEAWYETRVVDPETDERVAPGEPGELLVRPKVPWTTSPGYLGMPDRTIEAFRNLWFHTGNAVRCDDDGYLWFVDRLGDRIRRVENVSSLEVETVLHDHPAVDAAPVIGVPTEDEAGEDEILACLEPAEGAVLQDLPEGLWAWCERRLPYFLATPRFLSIVTSLPRAPTGKIRKDELRRGGLSADLRDRGPVSGRQSRRRPTPS